MSGAPGMMAGGPRRGVNVGGGSSTGRAIFALCGGLAGAYYGFYLQSKYMEERRVFALVETEARKRLEEEKVSQK
ncbi:hypothetical protein PR003_g19549 [Phytophthora rubi]|uniref:Uncharacterized protein n=1 Tax=Phytophthora rubi TaxID=129364 RepID=A0A6A3K4F5_9STRA|nr:hypothetical protein PR002_g19043 [Phytophthora rubi]KAE9001132.1 hypothetical protein PR001_g18603 [Phytophthora rubi]KAE9313238.1 hypothetical protein PR003_g19549 [Phytophthora rubi]